MGLELERRGRCLVCRKDVYQDEDDFFHYASRLDFAPGYGSAFDEYRGGRYTAYLCDLCLLAHYRAGDVVFTPGSSDTDEPERTAAQWERTERIVKKQVAGEPLTDEDLAWPEETA